MNGARRGDGADGVAGAGVVARLHRFALFVAGESRGRRCVAKCVLWVFSGVMGIFFVKISG